jgi:hypothetical protein
MGKTSSGLTYAELIRTELKGKFAAVERYDSMLWKIRSGYIVILYGALGLLGQKGFIPKEIVAERWLLLTLLLVGGFSLSAFIVDMGFIAAKLRVVKQSDLLYDLAVDLASGENAIGTATLNQAQTDAGKLKDLLHNAGESRKPFDTGVFLRLSLMVSVIYVVLPMLTMAFYWCLK